MKRELTLLALLVGCTTPSPTPMLREAPAVDDESVVPAVLSPDEALRDTSAGDASAPPAEASSAQPLDPAIDVAIAKAGGPVCPSRASTCGAGCMPIGGMKFDDANRCYARVTLGCMQATYANRNFVNGDLFCSVRDDGAVFVGSYSLLHQLGSGWGARRCTPEEWGNDGTERPMCPQP